MEILESLKAHLEEGKTARTFEGFGEDEDIDRVIGESDLLSAKKVIYAANMDEEGFTGNDTENERLKAVQAIADAEGAMVLPICAKLEEGYRRHGRRGEGDVPVRTRPARVRSGPSDQGLLRPARPDELPYRR